MTDATVLVETVLGLLGAALLGAEVDVALGNVLERLLPRGTEATRRQRLVERADSSILVADVYELCSSSSSNNNTEHEARVRWIEREQCSAAIMHEMAR